MNKVAIVSVGFFGIDFQNYIKKQSDVDAHFVSITTNSSILEHSTAQTNILLPKKSSEPIQHNEDLQRVFQEFETIIFLTAFTEDTVDNILIPLVELSKSYGNQIIHITTIPFNWEGKIVRKIALEKAEILHNICDVSGYFDNNALKICAKTLGDKPHVLDILDIMSEYVYRAVSPILNLPSFDANEVSFYIKEQTDVLNNLLEQAK